MKHLIIGVLILAVLVCGCVLNAYVISNRTDSIITPLFQAILDERGGDHSSAEKHAAKSSENWEASRKLFDALLSHEHVDEISLQFNKLPALQAEELTKTCSDLILMLENIAELEQPLLHNIL